MSLWTSREAANALGQAETSTWEATGVSIDTRTLLPGDLYIAIRGGSHDGHRFVEEAFTKGAAAAVVERPVPLDARFPQIKVEHTLRALTQLGGYARSRTNATIIAVTGSVGKTSVKELLRHVLGAFATTFASPASYNNHWGVPLSLACMPRDTRYGIFETGMNHRGEIAPLAQLVRPHIGVITAIAEAHIGHMVSRSLIAEEKSDIFAGRPVAELAVLNQDNPESEMLASRARTAGVSKILGFGKAAGADVRLNHYRPAASGLNGRVKASVGGHEVEYTLLQPGEHMAINSLIGLALGDALGLDQLKLIRQLETLPAFKGRGQYHKILVPEGEILLIDDAYNANLASMQAGLTVLGQVPVPPAGKRIAVLGEMLELGEQAEAHHQQLMECALAQGVELVFAAGGPVMANAFRRHIPHAKAGGYALQAADLVPLLVKSLSPGDIVFVKGSRGSRVNEIVSILLDYNKRETGAYG